MGDFKGAISNTVHVDEFKSKMGEDQDIVVISFKVIGEQPAEDLVNFIEKGYTWVLDADSSAGEMPDGDYVVFVEIKRTEKFPNQLIELLSDLENLCEYKLDDWEFLYFKDKNYKPVSVEAIQSSVPLNAKDYEAKYSDKPVQEIKLAAGLQVESRYSQTPLITQLQVWAGIK